MNFDEVHDLLWTAVEVLVEEDAEILPGTERTLAARLAVHLDRRLRMVANRENYVADVEFERMGADPKVFIGEARPRKIVPDVLVHTRGLHRGRENLLVVEVKPAGRARPEKVKSDHAKIALMTGVDDHVIAFERGLGRVGSEALGLPIDEHRLPPQIVPYFYGLWLKFEVNGVSQARWFVNQPPTVEWVETGRHESAEPQPNWR